MAIGFGRWACAVMGYKKVRAASPLRRSRFWVCLAPSPTYLGRVFWCAFELLAPRSGKKMQPGVWRKSPFVSLIRRDKEVRRCPLPLPPGVACVQVRGWLRVPGVLLVFAP
jgi:hypothetical protein